MAMTNFLMMDLQSKNYSMASNKLKLLKNALIIRKADVFYYFKKINAAIPFM